MLMEIDTRRKGKGLQYETITITPSIAAAMLEKNANNRKPTKSFVTQFTKDMAANNWRMTGDSIKFDSDGLLVDGQHRLMACVASERPFKTLVVYGVDANVKDVVDTGRARSATDMLVMAGVTNPSGVAATIKLIFAEKYHVDIKVRVTNIDVGAILGRHPKLPLYVPYNAMLPKGISAAHVGYINYVAGHIIGRSDRAGAFLNVIKSGVPDYDGDPVHRYREKIIRFGTDTGFVDARSTKFNTLKHVWNLFSVRKPLSRLDWQAERVAIEGLDLKQL